MHKILGIADDKQIKDVYTSGKKLAEDLVAKVGKKKASGMLAFAANVNKGTDVLDKALHALKSIKEAAGDHNMPFTINDISPIFMDTHESLMSLLPHLTGDAARKVHDAINLLHEAHETTAEEHGVEFNPYI